MPQQNVIVKLSLKDAELVKRGLADAGEAGERALKRIDAAGRQPSAGLKALSAASDELRGSLGNLAGSAGTVGNSLAALGPRGLAAAAGIGAVVIVLGKLVAAAREAGDFFAQLGDDAERAGTSASKLATIQGVFIANASSADEANAALVRLRGVIDDAISGSEKAQQAFQNVGISLDWLKQNGGDTVDVLMKIAQHSGLTAGQMNDLTGKIGNALVPAMQALSQVGVQASEDFDNLTKEINETRDRIEILDRQMQALSMDNAKAFLEAVEIMKTGLRDLEAWFLRTAAANAAFWKRLQGASMSDWLWGDPIKDALTERNTTLETEKTTQDDRMAIVSGRVKTEQALRNLRVPYAGSLSAGKAPKPKGGGRRGKSEAERQAEQEARDFLANSKVEIDLRKDLIMFGDERGQFVDKAISRLSEGATDAQIARVRELADALYDLKDKRKEDEKAEQARQKVMDEGTRIMEQMRTPAEQYAATLENLNQLHQKGAIDADTYARATAKAKEELDGANKKGEKTVSLFEAITGRSEVVQRKLDELGPGAKLGFEIADNAGQMLASTLTDIATGAEDAETAFTNLAKAVARMALEETLRTVIRAGLNAAIMAAAKGDTFMAALPEGVYTRPTLFPMRDHGFHAYAGGVGLLGEAGPEAVLPLRRGPSGRLGVEAQGGGRVVNNVTVVNNHPNAKVSSSEQKNGQGGNDLTVVIDAVEAAMAQRMSRPGTNLNKALATASNPVRAR